MDDVIGIAIPILLFVVPVLISVLDTRRKKAAGQKQVVSRPLEFPEEQKTDPVVRTTVHRMEQQRFNPSLSGSEVKSGNVLRKRPAAADEPEGEHRMSVDPRKLILYSEIMKPKFDE